jgi:hypothetical protein
VLLNSILKIVRTCPRNCYDGVLVGWILNLSVWLVWFHKSIIAYPVLYSLYENI